MSRSAIFRQLVLLLAAFTVAASVNPASAATTLWWNTDYADRFEIDVTTGANVPDKGYVGYTARVATLDTQALIAAGDMQADCSDLRITYYNGIGWQELSRHVLNCNTTTTDIRFALVVDIVASSNDDNYYLYYNFSSPAALPGMTTTNVYLWFDDASIDRSGNAVGDVQVIVRIGDDIQAASDPRRRGESRTVTH